MRRTLLVMAALTVLLIGFGIFIYVKARPFTHDVPIPVGRPCQVRTDAGAVGLEADQMANAATIAAVGLSRLLPDRAIVVALATAMQESELINIDYGDRDSIGLFQQRPSMGWGTPEQVGDPRYAAHAFYNKLVTIPGWEEMRVTEAAQAVQRSAFPEAYEKWVDEATVLAEALVGQAGATLSCARLDAPSVRGHEAATALRDLLRLDWNGGADSAAAVVGVNGAEISVAAPGARVGWQYAHWLVAHAAERGVQWVRYADQTWDADSGKWSHVRANPDDVRQVVARVYPP
jgi:hypothetical protein